MGRNLYRGINSNSTLKIFDDSESRKKWYVSLVADLRLLPNQEYEDLKPVSVQNISPLLSEVVCVQLLIATILDQTFIKVVLDFTCQN